MDSSGLSKKEYLKKYLGGGEKKKKKKKSTQSLIIKSKIVDDDIDLKSMKPIDEDELDIYDLAEEAPQIVGIIDERPEEVRLMSEFRSTKKWKIVADGIEDVKITSVDHRKTDEGTSRVEKEISIQITKNVDKNKSDSDESPPRSKKTTENDEHSEIIKNIKKEPESDSSPPRRGKNSDSDSSPPRKHTKDKSKQGLTNRSRDSLLGKTIKKEKDDSDTSPPRKRKEKYDSDTSPPRRRRHKDDSDTSPPRKRKERNDLDSSPPRRRKEKNDSDTSPPRRRHKNDSDTSFPRRKRREKDESDRSPPRRRRHKDDSDTSPPRRKKHRDSDSSPPNRRKNSDSSPPRKSTSNRKKESTHRSSRRSEERSRRRSRSCETSKSKKNGDYGLKVISKNDDDSKKEKKSSQIEKTLSGKKAGLQSAEEMRKEGEKLKQKEKEMFEKMSDDVTGRHATTVVRNRKTGRHHDAKEEARKKREKEEKEAEKIAQYAVWGKGVKQVQDRQDKIKDDLYEMSKPLARYKDDKDLEEMLKNQEREGDPMLEYIRKKKKTESSKPSKPEYEGLYPPNRYNIKPGHKWDGVDRSNGYEKKWFEEQSAKKAREEEAFKWSTYDM